MFYCWITVFFIFLFYWRTVCVESKKDCANITNLFPNGKVNVIRSNKLKLSCNSGYELYGIQYLVCSDQGIWSPGLPVCIKDGCQKLPKIKHGSFQKVDKKYPGKLQSFTCVANYQLFGADRLLCNGNTWNGNPPVCKPFNSKEEEFISDFENTLFNGWTQGNDDKLDWIRWSGPTPSEGTGPLSDHTFKTSDGHYLYLETSEVVVNDDAKLFSVMFPVHYSTDRCIEFYYHILGNDTGTLNVYVKPYNSAEKSILKISGSSNENWVRGFAKIGQQSKAFQIVFHATVGSYYSDIAIDDVRLLKCSKATATPAPTSIFTTVDRELFSTVASQKLKTDAQSTTIIQTTPETTSTVTQATTETITTLITWSSSEKTTEHTTGLDSVSNHGIHDEITQLKDKGKFTDNLYDSSPSYQTAQRRESYNEDTTLNVLYSDSIDSQSDSPFSEKQTFYSGIDSSTLHQFFTNAQQWTDDDDHTNEIIPYVSESDTVYTLTVNTYRTTSETVDAGLSVDTSNRDTDNDFATDNEENESSEGNDSFQEEDKIDENSLNNDQNNLKEKRSESVGNVIGLVGSLIAVVLSVGILALGIRAWKRRRASQKPKPTQLEEGELKEIVVEEKSPDDPVSQQLNPTDGAADLTVADIEGQNEMQDAGNERKDKTEESLVQSETGKLHEKKSLELKSIDIIGESKEGQSEIKDKKEIIENKLEISNVKDDVSLVNSEEKTSEVKQPSVESNKEEKLDQSDTRDGKYGIVDVTNIQDSADIHRSEETWDLTKTGEDKTEEHNDLSKIDEEICAETPASNYGAPESDPQAQSKEKGFTFSLFKNFFHRKEKKVNDTVQPNAVNDASKQVDEFPETQMTDKEEDKNTTDLPDTKIREEGTAAEQVKKNESQNVKKLKKEKENEEKRRKKEERKKQKEEKKSKKKESKKTDEKVKDNSKEKEEKIESNNDRDQVPNDKDKVLSNKDNVLSDKDNVLSDKDNVLSDKDNVLNVKDQVPNDKDNALNDKDNVLNDKDKVLSDKDNVLNVKDQVPDDKDNVLIDKINVSCDKVFNDAVHNVPSIMDNDISSSAKEIDDNAQEENVKKIMTDDKLDSNIQLSVPEANKVAHDCTLEKTIQDNTIVVHL